MQIGFDKSHSLNGPRHPVMATIATANFDDSLKGYQSELGYDVVDTGNLSAGMAAQWGLPELTGARTALLRPKSGAPVFFRFIEIEISGQRTEKPLGWFALEICVKDVEALYELSLIHI